MAKQLDPPPIAFADRSRAAQRSPFALYQVIDQGLEGTAMQSFADLPAEDKWALAFAAGRFAYPDQLARQGERIWADDAQVRSLVPDLDALAGLSEESLAGKMDPKRAGAVIAYLRAHPEAVTGQPATLSLARQRLRESVEAYKAGDSAKARSLALSAYLDGFEPVEAVLATKNGDLLATIERDMAALRSAIAAGKPAAEVERQADQIDALFGDVETTLSADDDSAVSSFIGALTILLREGLEALLIVIGMLAFIRKADRPEMARPVHYGWAAALAAGGLTWWAATSLITVSGASRELTEGFGSLLAAVVLLFVGIWMHGKAQAGQWQRYIREKMSRALTGRSAWFLFALAFVAVYREIFETILFYAAMAAQGHVGALVAGGVTGAVLLAAIAVAMLRYSQRLPIGKFFAYSSALVAILAVVLAGKGVAALQEAGMLGVEPLAGLPRIDILGLFPTVQTVAVQVVTLVILIAGFAWNRKAATEAHA
jgi:high-affinity iron transporter